MEALRSDAASQPKESLEHKTEKERRKGKGEGTLERTDTWGNASRIIVETTNKTAEMKVAGMLRRGRRR
jgi:hypothetical protein